MLKTCFLLCFLTKSYDVKRGHMTSKLFGRYKKHLSHKTTNFDTKNSYGCREISFFPVGHFILIHPVQCFSKWNAPASTCTCIPSYEKKILRLTMLDNFLIFLK